MYKFLNLSLEVWSQKNCGEKSHVADRKDKFKSVLSQFCMYFSQEWHDSFMKIHVFQRTETKNYDNIASIVLES